MRFFKFKRKSKNKIKKRIALKNYTLGGRISTILSTISLVLLLWAVLLSYSKNGHGGNVVGLIAFFSMGTSLAGFIFGVRSFYEKGAKFLKFTWIGTITSMLLVLFYAGMLLAYV